MQVEATVPRRTVSLKTPAEFCADHARFGPIWRGLHRPDARIAGRVASAAVCNHASAERSRCAA